MFTDYPLAERVQAALSQRGFTTPTPIQAESLPHTLSGRDLLGQARTGTGKTLAFGLPIASRLAPDSARGRAPRAFILTPTRELALQVAGELSWLAPHLSVVTVYGGAGYGHQASQLARGCDVVVATPGRALDYLEQGVLKLGSAQIVVLDEADEMLSMGFEKDVETLLAQTPRDRQTMLFSATLPAWALRLTREVLRDPVHLDLISGEGVLYEEHAIEAPVSGRAGVLSDLLHLHAGDKAIIFTSTKAEVDALARDLAEAGHAAEAIHGDLNQTQRERVLSRFRGGLVTALIGTDVAARGLDIPEVDLVIHYRLPHDAESYQHRSGRTGRAGRAGQVALLHAPREQREVTQLERAVGRRFKRMGVPTPATVQNAKLANTLRRAQALPERDRATWNDVAEDILQRGDRETLAGLLGLLLGGAPAPRSLLTGEEGWTTLELAGEVSNPGQVMRLVKAAGASEVGRIQVGRTRAYVDLRAEDALRLARQPDFAEASGALEPQRMPETRGPRRSMSRAPRRSVAR
jgi:ATP-dependent RNA helicase DeaD